MSTTFTRTNVWLWWKGSSTYWPTTYSSINSSTPRTRNLGRFTASIIKESVISLFLSSFFFSRSLQTPFFVLHVTLWSADRTEERNIISNPPKCTRVLMGSLVSSPSLLKNPQGEQGLYFAFPDLSIRTEGQYTLRFSLIKLVSADFQPDAKSKIIAQVFSDPFTVYSAKKVSWFHLIFAAYEISAL